ncbi:MAG: hypothetical protein KA956_08065 [Pyrinomonadaceae bacterium]|nr:hypothetical protein [Acidobacteriota bacterium]MBP7376419.1 hypothetical protein [Pyrinomonadaceae bacterium]
MKKYLVLGLMAAGSLFAGCNATGTPVEYANVCDKANDDKNVEVVGFLDNKGGAMCSSGYGKPMRCPISFKADLAAEKGINADIDKGTGSSSIDEYEKGKGLKIKDDKGEFIERTQKVKIVAEVNVFDTPEPATAGCYIVVKKIEKAQ